MGATDVRIEKLEQLIQERPAAAAHAMDPKIAEQLLAMESQIAALRQGKASQTDVVDRECTAVLGGLTALADEAEAATWLKDKLASLAGPVPIDIYIKGDDFRGIIFG
eukprot:16451629-Heterocapsa_arctica.AAC.1